MALYGGSSFFSDRNRSAVNELNSHRSMKFKTSRIGRASMVLHIFF